MRLTLLLLPSRSPRSRQAQSHSSRHARLPAVKYGEPVQGHGLCFQFRSQNTPERAPPQKSVYVRRSLPVPSPALNHAPVVIHRSAQPPASGTDPPSAAAPHTPAAAQPTQESLPASHRQRPDCSPPQGSACPDHPQSPVLHLLPNIQEEGPPATAAAHSLPPTDTVPEPGRQTAAAAANASETALKFSDLHSTSSFLMMYSQRCTVVWQSSKIMHLNPALLRRGNPRQISLPCVISCAPVSKRTYCMICTVPSSGCVSPPPVPSD